MFFTYIRVDILRGDGNGNGTAGHQQERLTATAAGFREKGRRLLPPGDAEWLRLVLMEAASDKEQLVAAYRHRVSVLCPGFDSLALRTVDEAKAALEHKSTDEVGFLQMFNLHRKYSKQLIYFTHHPRLCQAASLLLSSKRLRLYQDCLFLKFPGFGETNWHSDLNMVPVDTNSFLTFWITLQHLSPTDSCLHFATGSHRDFALAYWQSNKGMENLDQRGYPIHSYKDLNPGDVTAHHGWTLHYAPEQPPSCSTRLAWTVSYFADGARLLCTKHTRRKFHDEDSPSYRDWYSDLREGQPARHKLLQLVRA